MQPRGIPNVRNFGGNIHFRPRKRYLPKDEEDVLRILDDHRTGTVRVIGAGHSWNGGIETSDALLDLRRLRRIRVHSDRRRVSVGGGCRIAELLAHLAPRELTLPSIGLIAGQTVAGAIATGTHGSGRHSMSHYVESVRIACYDAAGEAEVRTVDSGQALRAARCSVGALGVVLEVTLRCVPQYYVRERCVWRPNLDAVLDNESAAPLQQFYLIPHTWAYLEHERCVASDNRRSGAAMLYRAYWLIVIDVLLHLGIKLTASLLRSRRLVDFIYRRLLPVCIFPKWRVTDRSDRQLLMRHDLFRHLEMEVFVQRAKLKPALDLVSEVLRAADNADYEASASVHDRIRALGMQDALEKVRGSYSHHYPICVRRVPPDGTLISMASCHGMEEQDWYAISLITFTEPRRPFQNVARFLATTMALLFNARLHWGKWFPLNSGEVERSYPGIREFRAVCKGFDPRGVFRNPFLEKAIFRTPDHHSS
ncbi:MAG: FAD-binding protein [Gammaproteobacteria bacterium]|nr:FAD-binding protein [Gammaproteobacteria bacterium]MYD00408.1 FAD-binding protein [Gammaproteobacteria bacterium]